MYKIVTAVIFASTLATLSVGGWLPPGLRGGIPPWGPAPPPPWAAAPPQSVVFRRPMDAMVDLTNDLGVAILQDNAHARSNFAFSPYGLASVLVVLYEGALGESARQIHMAARFPWDKDITRIGFRDIHRHLRSYFSHEGYLSGITLNKDSSALRSEFKRILRFYGYDVDLDPPKYPVPKPGSKPMDEVPIITPPPKPKPGHPFKWTTRAPTTIGSEVTLNLSSENPAKEGSDGITEQTVILNVDEVSATPAATTVPSTTVTGPVESSPGSEQSTSEISNSVTEASLPVTESEMELISVQDVTNGIVDTTATNAATSGETSTQVTVIDNGMVAPGASLTVSPDTGETSATVSDTVPEGTQQPTTQIGDSVPLSTTTVQTPERETVQTATSPMLSTYKSGLETDTTFETLEPRDDEILIATETTEALSTTKSLAGSEQPTTFQSNPTLEVSTSPSETSPPERVDQTTTEFSTTNAIGTTFQEIDRRIDLDEPTTSVGTTLNELEERIGEEPLEESSTAASEDSTSSIGSTSELRNNDSTQSTEELKTDVIPPSTTTLDSISTTDEPTTEAQSTENTLAMFTEPLPSEDVENKVAEVANLVRESIKDNGMSLMDDQEDFVAKTIDEYLMKRKSRSSSLKHSAISDWRVPQKNDVFVLEDESSDMVTKGEYFMDQNYTAPVNFQTDAVFSKMAARRYPRAISSLLHTPSVPDLSLQLQNGMFDSHVSRKAELYRPLPRQSFLVDASVETPVPVMTYTNVFPYAFIPRLHSAALEFPLDDERYKLLIILPVERRGLRQLSYDLSAVTLRGVLDALRPARVKATVPTFMVEGFVILTPALQRLGVWNVFDPRRANLTGMSPDPELYVRNIEQSVTVVIRNYVEILDIQTRTMAARGATHEFIATHPFLYFVLDSETNVALMAGQMLDPLNSRIY